MLNSHLASFLRDLVVIESQSFGPLRVDFLKFSAGPRTGGVRYLTLPQALASTNVVVEEISDGGQVSGLRLINRLTDPVLLLGGEILRGGKQDRTVNTDIFVQAGATVCIPVSCVEQGRWGFRTRRFGSGSYSSPSVRYALHRSVSKSYETTGTPTSDQSAVWGSVAYVGHQSRHRSPTGNLSEHYESAVKQLEEVKRGIRCPQDAVGMVVRIGGQFLVADVFDAAETLRQYFPMLMEGHTMDCLAEWGTLKAPEAGVDNLLTIFETLDASEHKGIGAGSEVRFVGGQATGSALLVEDAPLHVMVVKRE